MNRLSSTVFFYSRIRKKLEKHKKGVNIFVIKKVFKSYSLKFSRLLFQYL